MRVNHVGYVVKSIEAYAQSLPGLKLIKSVNDPLQQADIALYGVGDGSHIELIQPLTEQAFTWAFLQRNGEGPHHICYEGLPAAEVDSLISKHRMLKVRGPIYAPLFEREVVFAVTRQRAIVEFIL